MTFYSSTLTCVITYDSIAVIIVYSAYMSYPSLLDPCRTVWLLWFVRAMVSCLVHTRKLGQLSMTGQNTMKLNQNRAYTLLLATSLVNLWFCCLKKSNMKNLF